MATSPGPCRTEPVSSPSRPLSLPSLGGGGTGLLSPEDLSTHQAGCCPWTRPATHHVQPPGLSSASEHPSQLPARELSPDTPPTYRHLHGLQDRGPGWSSTPDRVWGTGLHLPITCLPAPQTAGLLATPTPPPAPFSWDQEELSCPRAKEELGLEPKALSSLLHPQSPGKAARVVRG